jgi:hypothetical protein
VVVDSLKVLDPKRPISEVPQADIAARTYSVAVETCSASLRFQPSAEGEHVAGIYRQRLNLSSGRFAMIDDGLGFQLVPWRPALERHLGKQVSGVMMSGGKVDWSFDRKRGLGL